MIITLSVYLGGFGSLDVRVGFCVLVFLVILRCGLGFGLFVGFSG